MSAPEKTQGIFAQVTDGGASLIFSDGHRVQELSADDARELHDALEMVLPMLKPYSKGCPVCHSVEYRRVTMPGREPGDDPVYLRHECDACGFRTDTDKT